MSKSSPAFFSVLEKELGSSFSQLLPSLENLRAGFTSSKDKRLKGYMNDPKSRLAYLFYYLPLHFPEIYWVLEQIQAQKIFEQILQKQRTLKILDVGAGPATASLGLQHFLNQKLKKSFETEFTLWDLSPKVLSLGKKLLKTEGAHQVQYEEVDLRRPKLSSSAKSFDVILMSHCLNEWGSGPRHREEKLNLLGKLFSFLSPQGILILLEPPLRESTLDLMWIRDEIARSEVLHVLAPCPKGTRLCPMALNKFGWCYAQPPRQIFREKGIAPWDSKIEKLLALRLTHPGFSYLVISPFLHDSLPTHRIALTDSQAKSKKLCSPKGLIKGEGPYRGAYVFSKE